jgi:hypothetical protein
MLFSQIKQRTKHRAKSSKIKYEHRIRPQEVLG